MADKAEHSGLEEAGRLAPRVPGPGLVPARGLLVTAEGALGLRGGFPFTDRGAGVEAAGADEAVVVELFDDVGGPADDAGDDEERRVEIDGEAEIVIEPSTGPIDVGRELFFGADYGFDGFGHA